MTRSLLIFSAMVILFSACKKAEDTNSSEDILRAGRWKRSSLKGTFRGAVTDAYASLPDCIKDNTLEFKVNFNGTEHRNTKCSAGDADQASFNWEFFNSGKNLRIYNANETFANASINAEVLQLSETQLSMRYLAYIQDPIQQTMDTVTIVDVFRR
jgi:hypothetical protein